MKPEVWAGILNFISKLELRTKMYETLDLRSELNVRSQDSNRTEVVQVPPTTGKLIISNPSKNLITDSFFCHPVRPPVRATPLSIVNDLLRKVGVIETKLASYHRKEEQPSKRFVFSS